MRMRGLAKNKYSYVGCNIAKTALNHSHAHRIGKNSIMLVIEDMDE